MSETPQGPQGPDEPDFRELFEQLLGDVNNPAMAEALKSMGIDRIDPAAMGMLAGQLSALFQAAPSEGVNLELSADVARKTVAAGGDRIVGTSETAAVIDAVHVATLWLDAVTELPGPPGRGVAWSRAEWVAGTMPTWGRLVDPVAQGVTDAVAAAMRNQLERFSGGELPQLPGMPPLPEGMNLAGLMEQFGPMLARMSSSMFGAQIGQAVGSLAAEVVSGTEVGLPLVQEGQVVLLPDNVAAFAEGLEVDDAQVRLYLAVREAARVRLFAGVSWLAPQVVNAVQAYARDISIDTEGIEATISSLDPTDLESMQQALAGGLFTPEPSQAQQVALTRLETLLALIEGWVDAVSEDATREHLPQAAALGEAVRRRRATGGPAEHLFSRLVGLELRPRRLRDAANLFAALENAAGRAARDGAWANPDMAPTAADLDDVLGYVEKMTAPGGGADELDAALERLLAGGDAPAPSSQQGPSAADAEGPADAGPWPRSRRAEPDDGPTEQEQEDGPGPEGPADRP